MLTDAASADAAAEPRRWRETSALSAVWHLPAPPRALPLAPEADAAAAAAVVG